MEDQQANMVSRDQSTNSEVLGNGGRPKRNVPPKHLDPEVYDLSNNDKTSRGQRGSTQARGGTRGRGGTNRTVSENKANTRASSSALNSEPIQQNSERNENVDSDNESVIGADLQLGEVMEKVGEMDTRIDRNAENANNFLLALIKVLNLPIEAINGLKQIAKDNENSETHTWLQNCVAMMGTRNYAEVVETGNETETETQQNTVRRTEAVSQESVRQIVRQETPVILKQMFEDSKRKKNIIIIGMREGYDDCMLVEDMLKQMGCWRAIRDICRDPIRLGVARRGKKRPIKVEFRDEEAVEFIIRNKTTLKYTGFCTIYINRDLSYEERERERENRRRNGRNGNSRAEEENASNSGSSTRNSQNPNTNRNGNNATQSTGRTSEVNNREMQSQNAGGQTHEINESASQNLTTQQPAPIQGEGRAPGAGNEEGGSSRPTSISDAAAGRSDIVTDMTEVASSALQGITSILAAITPKRQGTAEPKRNIAREQSGERQNVMDAQRDNNSGNSREGEGSGGD